MQDLYHPLIVNIMVYRRRDRALYRELTSVPNKYRSERLRNLANQCCLLREMGGLSIDAATLNGLASRYAHEIDDVEEAEVGDEGQGKDVSMPIKLTVNVYNYPELYRDLMAVPNGSISSRIKQLASAGALLDRLSRLVQREGREPRMATQAPLTEPDTSPEPLNQQRRPEAQGSEHVASASAPAPVTAPVEADHSEAINETPAGGNVQEHEQTQADEKSDQPPNKPQEHPRKSSAIGKIKM
ncbi:hypothetical protein [Vreelandella massiliensis]|uniref:hypothetical protein n=1 Tax=Vreelandella massiliensis TaxID=1816686 RepID=UPI00096AC9D0|nr:hypothetical protein [Halomonas massiliensis]